MGLRDDIYESVSEAFDTDLADAVENVTITKYARDQYDPDTGRITGTVLNTENTRGVYTGDWQYEVYNSAIEPRDQAFLMLQDELSFEPEIGTIVESTVRGRSRVIEFRKDPANVTYEFRIRF